MRAVPTKETTDAETLSFPVAGMNCQACAHSVEQALLSVPGVKSAEVNFGSRSARVERDPKQAHGSDLRRAVVGAGYGVPEDLGDGTGDLRHDLDFAQRAENFELRDLQRNAAAAMAFARFEDVLGVYGEPPAAAGAAPEELQAKALERQAARDAKDFAKADQLRDEITAAGFQIVDTAEGPRLEPL